MAFARVSSLSKISAKASTSRILLAFALSATRL
jgi:hypothetical protein